MTRVEQMSRDLWLGAGEKGRGSGHEIVHGKGLNGVSCLKKNVEGALRLLNRN